jgi:hypothetical protein
MDTTTDLTAHFTTGAVIVYFMQMLKRRGWLIGSDTKGLNRALSMILAGVAAVGINWTYDATAGTLVISGLTWAAVGAMAWEWLKQFVAQQVLWDGVVQRPKVEPRRAWTQEERIEHLERLAREYSLPRASR